MTPVKEREREPEEAEKAFAWRAGWRTGRQSLRLGVEVTKPSHPCHAHCWLQLRAAS